jgi:hypothetical protein
MSEKLTAEKIAEMADKGMDITPYLSTPQKGHAGDLSTELGAGLSRRDLSNIAGGFNHRSNDPKCNES